MKGSGLFVLSVLLLAAVLITYFESVRRAQQEFGDVYTIDAKYARLATLRNVIQRSYEKTDRYHLDAWKLAVQTTLADEYGVSISINSSKVTVSSDELRVRSEFYVR